MVGRALRYRRGWRYAPLRAAKAAVTTGKHGLGDGAQEIAAGSLEDAPLIGNQRALVGALVDDVHHSRLSYHLCFGR
ncbi:hypothetical protein D3C78_1569840 [compost metagenome]